MTKADEMELSEDFEIGSEEDVAEKAQATKTVLGKRKRSE
jgi:hypothetical protein